MTRARLAATDALVDRLETLASEARTDDRARARVPRARCGTREERRAENVCTAFRARGDATGSMTVLLQLPAWCTLRNLGTTSELLHSELVARLVVSDISG